MKRMLQITTLVAVSLLCLAALAQAAASIRIQGAQRVNAGQPATFNVIIEDPVGLRAYEIVMDTGQRMTGAIGGKTFIMQGLALNTNAGGTRVVRIRAQESNGRWGSWREYRVQVIGSSANPVPQVSLSGPSAVTVGQNYPLRYGVRAGQPPLRVEIRDPFTHQVRPLRVMGASFNFTAFVQTRGRQPGQYTVAVRAQAQSGRWSQWVTKRFTLNGTGGHNSFAAAIQGPDTVVQGRNYSFSITSRSSEPLAMLQVRHPFNGRVSSMRIRGTNFQRRFYYPTQGVRPGSYYLQARASTVSGNWSQWSRKDFRVTSSQPVPQDNNLVVLDGPDYALVNHNYVLNVRVVAPSGVGTVEIRNPFTGRAEYIRGAVSNSQHTIQLSTRGANTGDHYIRVRAQDRVTGQWGSWITKRVHLRNSRNDDNIPHVTIYSRLPLESDRSNTFTYYVKCLQQMRVIEIQNPFNGRIMTKRDGRTSFVDQVSFYSGGARPGTYTLRVRAQNVNGQWSMWYSRDFVLE